MSSALVSVPLTFRPFQSGAQHCSVCFWRGRDLCQNLHETRDVLGQVEAVLDSIKQLFVEL